jgi:hypothetical protein
MTKPILPTIRYTDEALALARTTLTALRGGAHRGGATHTEWREFLGAVSRVLWLLRDVIADDVVLAGERLEARMVPDLRPKDGSVVEHEDQDRHAVLRGIEEQTVWNPGPKATCAHEQAALDAMVEEVYGVLYEVDVAIHDVDAMRAAEAREPETPREPPVELPTSDATREPTH